MLGRKRKYILGNDQYIIKQEIIETDISNNSTSKIESERSNIYKFYN